MQIICMGEGEKMEKKKKMHLVCKGLHGGCVGAHL